MPALNSLVSGVCDFLSWKWIATKQVSSYLQFDFVTLLWQYNDNNGCNFIKIIKIAILQEIAIHLKF